MARDPEPRLLPRGDEQVCAAPSIEAHAKNIGPQNSIHLCVGGRQPGVVVVVDDVTSVAAAVIRDVGRIGEDEIDRAVVESLHGVDALAVDHGVDEADKGCGTGRGYIFLVTKPPPRGGFVYLNIDRDGLN
jgi:hypothetical protein